MKKSKYYVVLSHDENGVKYIKIIKWKKQTKASDLLCKSWTQVLETLLNKNGLLNEITLVS